VSRIILYSVAPCPKSVNRLRHAYGGPTNSSWPVDTSATDLVRGTLLKLRYSLHRASAFHVRTRFLQTRTRRYAVTSHGDQVAVTDEAKTYKSAAAFRTALISDLLTYHSGELSAFLPFQDEPATE